jgi:hypothetical protein
MLYYAQGTALVSPEELFESPAFDKLSSFHTDLRKGRAPRPVTFSTGKVTKENAIRGFATGARGAEPVAFPPIGPGRPLAIMIREIYTGKFPGGGLFGSKKDLLVTSAIKSIATFEAQPRAINFLTQKVSAKNRLERPKASEQGTPVVFYSPALLDRSLTLDLTLVFDTFPKEAFETVGRTFQAAAGIPIFISYSAYLVAAGAVAKIVGALGELLFDGSPAFRPSVALDLQLPGKPPLEAGFALITDGNVDSIDPDFRSKYHVSATGKVVDEKSKEYQGEIPYIVVSYDGTEYKEFSSFTPTAASAAILERFFGIKDKQAQSMDTLMDAIKLYNDVRFRRDADRLDDQIAKLPDGEEKSRLKEKRDAYVKNIMEDILRPKTS